MLLTADQVLQLIVDPRPVVRQQAADYFAFSWTERRDVADVAIRAIQQFGWDRAFQSYSFLAFLPLQLESLDWLLDELASEQVGEDNQFAEQIALDIAAVSVDLLAARRERLLAMSVFSEEAREEIEQRLSLRGLPPEQLWDNLIAWCTKNDLLVDLPGDYVTLPKLCEALGRFPEFSVPRVLQRLARPTRDPEDWLEIAAVRLAGELRLTDAIQPIVDRIAGSDDLLFEATEDALQRIGDDGVVTAMAAAFPQGDYGLELVTAAVLATIHSDFSVRTCLNLPLSNSDNEAFIALQLCSAALSSFASEAIEPGRQLVLAAPDEVEVMVVRRRVVAVCLAHGISIPELDDWAADVENDDAMFRQQIRMIRAERLRVGRDEDEEAWGGAAEPYAPAETIIRDHERVGRNDPCPCGSGKKYKKCCLSKEKAID